MVFVPNAPSWLEVPTAYDKLLFYTNDGFVFPGTRLIRGTIHFQTIPTEVVNQDHSYRLLPLDLLRGLNRPLVLCITSALGDDNHTVATTGIYPHAH